MEENQNEQISKGQPVYFINAQTFEWLFHSPGYSKKAHENVTKLKLSKSGPAQLGVCQGNHCIYGALHFLLEERQDKDVLNSLNPSLRICKRSPHGFCFMEAIMNRMKVSKWTLKTDNHE